MRIKITNIAGMNGYIDPAKLSEGECALLENYTLKSYGNVGSLVSRPGIQRYGDTQIASGGTGVGSGFEATLNGTDYMITNIINGSSSALYYKASPYTTGGWTAITGSGGSGRAYKLDYASFKDKVYMANNSGGTSSNTVWDGTTAGFYDMGCSPLNMHDGGLGFAATTGTNLTAGTYRYYITFLYDNNQESSVLAFSDTIYGTGSLYLLGRSVTTSGGNLAVAITGIPTAPIAGSNLRITARKIYRTKIGGTGDLYYLVGVLNDNVTTSFTDDKPDSQLGNAIDGINFFAVKKPLYAKYVAQHKERIVLANTKESQYSALATGDITITDSGTGGSLIASTTYKYRFYKLFHKNNNGKLNIDAGLYLEKSHTTGVGVTSVDIAFSGSVTPIDNYYLNILVTRTSGGGSDFKPVGATYGTAIASFPINDGMADASRTNAWGILDLPPGQSEAYPDLIKMSNGGLPDIFTEYETAPDGTLTTASNEWSIGEPITGIHSEENRIVIFANNNIHELDTRSQSRIFWNTNKIVSGIGADDGLQVQCGNRYVFIKNNATGNSKITIYEWDGRNEPQIASLSVQSWIEDNRVSTVKDLVYDQYNNRVLIITAPTAAINTAVLVYNLDLRDNSGIGEWEIWLNSSDLNLKAGIKTKNYGVIIGGGDGYIHYPLITSYRDIIAGSGALFTTKLRTKTFETFDSDLMIKNFRADITSTGAVTPSLKTAVDGTLNAGDNMTALASGFNRPRQTKFTDAQNRSYRQVYFQLEMSANEQYKVHGLTIDFDESAGDVGGR